MGVTHITIFDGPHFAAKLHVGFPPPGIETLPKVYADPVFIPEFEEISKPFAVSRKKDPALTREFATIPNSHFSTYPFFQSICT